ncbi:MAG: aminoglycoside phosphotransferase, partial [uncultured Blastococcus sp.]
VRHGRTRGAARGRPLEQGRSGQDRRHRPSAAARHQPGDARPAPASRRGRVRRSAPLPGHRRAGPGGAVLRPRHRDHAAVSAVGSDRRGTRQRGGPAAALPRCGQHLRSGALRLAAFPTVTLRRRTRQSQRPESGQRRVPGRPRCRTHRFRPGQSRLPGLGRRRRRPAVGTVAAGPLHRRRPPRLGHGALPTVRRQLRPSRRRPGATGLRSRAEPRVVLRHRRRRRCQRSSRAVGLLGERSHGASAPHGSVVSRRRRRPARGAPPRTL